MAWIYLAVSEDFQSLSNPTLEQLLTVKQTDTPKLSSYLGWLKAQLTTLLSAPMSENSRKIASIFQSTLSLEGSHARTSALQAKAWAWLESEAAFFTKSCAWPKKSSPRSYSWKTSLQSEHGDWTELSKNLPRQGMTVGGLCFPLQKLALHTSARDGSALLPTPRAQDAKGVGPSNLKRKEPGLNTRAVYGLWPTPTARDWKSGCASQATMERNSRPLSEKVGGSLNPTWVEWLMGFPSEWTALNDLGMQWYPLKRGKRLKS